MHERHSDLGFLFSLEQVAATEILLVGYSLFPCTRLEVHPRLTILSGNNAVGKTTILDAIQTVILCHQTYINLNVASGQNDRILAGQIKDRVAWAVLGITGHESVRAVGVRLMRKPASDQVDLEPFALSHVQPAQTFFLDPDTMLVTNDLQELRRRVVMTDMAGQVRDFAKLDEYHEFLHQEGIFPIPLMQRGIKRLYSGLWRQITQPKLGDLHKFLREMLCTAPRRKMGFDQVEQLMIERRKVEQRLNQLLKFKATREELQEFCRLYATMRRSALILAVALYGSFLQETRLKIRETENRIATLDARKAELEAGGQELSQDISDLEAELEKLYGRQTELQTQLRHRREYQKACQILDETSKTLQEIEPVLTEKNKALYQSRTRKEELQTRKNELEMKRAQQQERLDHRKREARQWQEYHGRIEEVERMTGWTLRSKNEIGAGREKAEREKRDIEDLPNLRKQANEVRKRAEAHEQARREWKKTSLLCGLDEGTDPTLEVLESIRAGEEEKRQKGKERTAELDAVIQQQTAERNLLLRGRPPLPEKAIEAVDKGMAVPLADRFEGLDISEARVWQQRLGPLALAVEPGPGVSPEELGAGVDPFWIYTGESPADQSSWKEPKGVEGGSIGGIGDFSWYQPDGAVWLSSKARELRIRELEQGLEASALERQILHEMIGEAQRKIDAAIEFRSLKGAFEDAQAPSRLSELTSRIHDLEEKRPEILRLAQMMTGLDRDAYMLEWRNAPEQVEELERHLKIIDEDLKGIGRELEQIRMTFSRLEKEVRDQEAVRGNLLERFRSSEQQKTMLEKEEPKEVLLGRVDLQEAEALEKTVREVKEKKKRQEKAQRLIHEEIGSIKTERVSMAKALEGLLQKEKTNSAEQENAVSEWSAFYPDVEPPKPEERPTHALLERARANREVQKQTFGRRMEQVASEHGLSVNVEVEPDDAADHLLEKMMPQGVDLDREEEQLNQLRTELKGIEARIRTYVEEIKRNVDADLNELGRRVHQVNRILSDLSFGRIKRVQLKSEPLPAYQGLKKLKGQQITLFSHGESISLQQFVQQVRDMVSRYARTEDISEEQIADYRTYVRMKWTITDTEGSTRDAGFSSGEGLGINLAICLSLLFYLSGGSDRSKVSGMLLMALDEAERLDERALHTVRTLLDRVNCQLLVALPRTLEVPSSLCHMLTPLPQGVTHISVYHEG